MQHLIKIAESLVKAVKTAMTYKKNVKKVWMPSAQCYAVRKKCKNESVYQREKNFYEGVGSKLKWVPKLLKFDDMTFTLWTEYCGPSLYLRYPAQDRENLLPEVVDLVNRLYKLKLFHNDIRWKNVCQDESGKMYLIDFENVSEENKFYPYQSKLHRDVHNQLGLTRKASILDEIEKIESKL